MRFKLILFFFKDFLNPVSSISTVRHSDYIAIGKGQTDKSDYKRGTFLANLFLFLVVNGFGKLDKGLFSASHFLGQRRKRVRRQTRD